MSGMVIVGGGLAGGRAAWELRKQGYEGDVTIIAGEDHGPYQRPPLSKGYLQDKVGLDKVMLHPQDWYEDQNITVIEGVPVEAIDRDAHTVLLTDGRELEYEKLLLATGSRARELPLPGADLEGIYTLRTLDDADALKAALAGGGKKVAIVGSGWVGMEVAATATELGNTVTVLGRDEIPLANALGDEIGGEFKKVHEENGVQFMAPVNIEGFVGDGSAGDGSVTGVLVDGETLPADVVVVGVGAIPNVELAQAAGLETSNGIDADVTLQTSDPDIYVAGDVANAYHPVVEQKMRSEHWSNALRSGIVAAKSMLGVEAAHDSIPYFYTDQFDLGMELSGYIPWMPGAQIVIRGDLPSKKFLAFWLKDGRVVAGMGANIWDANKTFQKLINSGQQFDPAVLADESVELATLVED